MLRAELVPILTVLVISMATPGVPHAGELNASVDRDSLYANETFQLELKADTELDFSLGSLLNPRALEIPMPDTAPLEASFRILDRNQHMSIQTTNGHNQGTVIWTFLLAPRKSGKLTIPSLTFRDSASAPIELDVVPGVAPPDDTPPRARLEVELSEEEIYVQQQVILRQSVFYEPPLIRGELSTPEVPNATIRSLGDKREFRAERDGREWQVVERRFAVVPQTEGTLRIPQQTFRARKRNEEGDLEFFRVASPVRRIDVKPPPPSFSGDLWLPAKRLEIDEEWSSPRSALRAGDSITRTIRISALGVAPEALPRIDVDYPDSLREYPQPWESESRLTEDSVEGRIRKRSALVPIEPGDARIPPVRLTWWDLENNQERVASLEGSKVAIAPAAGSEPRDGKPDAADGARPSDITLARSPVATLPPLWVWLAVILATGWLLTGIAWWRNRQRFNGPDRGLSAEEKANRERFQALCDRAQRGDADTLALLPQWASRHFANPGLKTVGDVTACINDPKLTREIQALERHLFANPEQRDPWVGDELVAALRQVAGKPGSH